jgi:hypothetical protein
VCVCVREGAIQEGVVHSRVLDKRHGRFEVEHRYPLCVVEGGCECHSVDTTCKKIVS